MVSYRGDELRVHDGYLAAPPNVLAAIVTFIEGRRRADRRGARRTILSFAIAAPPSRGPRRRERPRAEDAPFAARLTECHARYNTEHFGGERQRRAIRS